MRSIVIATLIAIACLIAIHMVTETQRPVPTDPLAQQLREANGTTGIQEVITKAYYHDKARADSLRAAQQK